MSEVGLMEEIDSERLQKLGEETVKCPVCGKKALRVGIYLYDVPCFGKVILETGRCESCGFKWTDVTMVEAGKGKRLRLRVKGEKELRALVVKSSSATVIIPELGVEIKPGPAAMGYITTVEGVVRRVLEHVPSECFNKSSECYKVVKTLEDAAEGRIEFTLILEDPMGRSGIKGEGVSIEEEELT